MLDGPLLLRVNLAVVFVSGLKIKATGESKLNDSPEIVSLHQAEHQATCLPWL